MALDGAASKRGGHRLAADQKGTTGEIRVRSGAKAAADEEACRQRPSEGSRHFGLGRGGYSKPRCLLAVYRSLAVQFHRPAAPAGPAAARGRGGTRCHGRRGFPFQRKDAMARGYAQNHGCGWLRSAEPGALR